ncbi:MAG: radical SAM protein [Termitinemataceae bacterium]|nr:MAG: radical SAM protein [Termitinemataceae bacterium]
MWRIWFVLRKMYRALLKIKLRFYKKNKNRKSLDYFEIHITDHCNLNCVCCCHFSPLAEKYFMDIGRFKNDFERLSKLSCGKIRRIRLLGGEPLLHPDMPLFIEIARKNFPKSEIAVCTNGILLTKMPEEFWKTCFDNNIEIDITYYPVSLDWTAINRLAVKHKITLKTNIDTSMSNFGNLQMDLSGSQPYKKNWYDCGHANGCINLYEGKLFTCDVLPHSKHLSKYFNIPLAVTEKDFVDIYEAKSMDEILQRLSAPTPFCRYCRPNEEKAVVWHTTEKKITEWARE